MILALCLLQDAFERADRDFRPFSEAVRIERAERRGDATRVLRGRLHVAEDRTTRLEVEGARLEDLPGLAVWRRPWSELRDEYEIAEERPAEPEEAVRGADGAAIAPVKVRLRAGPAVSLAEAPAGRALVLTPKSGGPRLKVWFDDASLRAERVAWDTRTHAVAVTLGGGGGSGPKDGAGPRERGVDAEERR
jgi:hypothetical protein